MQIKTTVQGLPCQAVVEYAPPETYVGPLDEEPPFEGEFDLIEILDRKGYPAQWLEDKVTAKDMLVMYEDAVRQYDPEL